MKKLNRKGFTLIELLAVIVVLAIIIVAVVPGFLGTVSDAKVANLWNYTKDLVISYDNISAQDLIAENATLKEKATTDWQCIHSISGLKEALSLSDKDISLEGNLPGTGASISKESITSESCSAIRVQSNGATEILLVAKPGGKFDISDETVYALSTDDAGVRKKNS